MKEIKAFVKPNRVQKVIEALSESGFKSMTLSQGEGTGAFKAKGATPSLDFRVTDSPVIKLELVCQNEEAQRAIDIIVRNGKTPEPGDGIIYVSDIEDALRIKTGESLKKLIDGATVKKFKPCKGSSNLFVLFNGISFSGTIF